VLWSTLGRGMLCVCMVGPLTLPSSLLLLH